ncbi:MAG: hypothetical protein KDA92_24450, partial [Planctomycetales bacterium]|nr:hypothetical protein [Planctomycetales bacterium]
GGWTWEQPGSGERPAPTQGTPMWFADLNLDQQISAADIDLLSRAVRDGNDDAARSLFEGFGFDLDNSGQIEQADHTYWVEWLKLTYLGDADFNGQFYTEDLVLAFQSGKYETDELALWREGDWNGDLRFDTSDFVWAFYSWPEDRPRAAVAVPEPAGQIMLGTALGLLVVGARWRTSDNVRA